MADLNKIYLFRLTHVNNIPHILKYGITHVKSKIANPNYFPIGDSSLISNRSSVIIPSGKMLGDYIPFYFGVRMPMLYVIQNGFNGVKAIAPEKIIYCVTSVQQMILNSDDIVFSDGHAVDSFSTFYLVKDITNIENFIDKDAINKKYWKDDNDLDLKRRKEAEFLVGNDIPSNAILGFYTYNENVKNNLINLGINERKILVRPKYYF